jgi:hypothetical protein
MLGEKIGDERGKVTSRRILPGDDYRFVKMEISFESQITVYGMAGMAFGTYTVFERIPGQMYGEGQGVYMTNDGESAIWNGHGVGFGQADGSIKFAASIAFQANTTGKLARLAQCLVLVEHTAAADGTITSTLHEWKA